MLADARVGMPNSEKITSRMGKNESRFSGSRDLTLTE